MHALWITRDLPAVKKVAGLKGHNGKLPCRFCLIEGIWCEAHRHNYYPLMVKDGGLVKRRYSSGIPPLRTVEETYETIAQLSLLNGQRKAELQLSNGIVEGSNLFGYPISSLMHPSQ